MSGGRWQRLRWALTLPREVIGVADPSLPATAPRCRECGCTVRPPGRLPLRYSIACQECHALETPW